MSETRTTTSLPNKSETTKPSSPRHPSAASPPPPSPTKHMNSRPTEMAATCSFFILNCDSLNHSHESVVSFLFTWLQPSSNHLQHSSIHLLPESKPRNTNSSPTFINSFHSCKWNLKPFHNITYSSISLLPKMKIRNPKKELCNFEIENPKT